MACLCLQLRCRKSHCWVRAGVRSRTSTAHATYLLISTAARLAAGFATCASRASGYDAPCAVVPARHYSKQRAQSTMHTSGILCLIDKCAASIRYLLQGRRRSPNYKGKDEPLGRAALSLSLSLSYRTGCPRHFACPLHPSSDLRLLCSLLSSWVPHTHRL